MDDTSRPTQTEPKLARASSKIHASNRDGKHPPQLTEKSDQEESRNTAANVPERQAPGGRE